MSGAGNTNKALPLCGAFGKSASDGIQDAAQDTDQAKPAYVSVRVTPEEKARLKQDAAGMPLSAYVRERLLGDAAKPRRGRGKFPVEDHEALARALSRLGRSELAMAIGALLLACEEQRLYLDKEQEAQLRSINADITFMRVQLIKALGLYPKDSP
ncbi:MAG: hypothetical protein AAGK00_00655 [Pseudomonadota bacterium]